MKSFPATNLVVASLFDLLGCVPSSLHPANLGAVATGQYRNLFVEAGHSPHEVTAGIKAAFQQLSHGDPNSQTVYFPAGTNTNGPPAYIHDIHSRDVRSEGMSYGSMLYLLASLNCGGEQGVWIPK